MKNDLQFWLLQSVGKVKYFAALKEKNHANFGIIRFICEKDVSRAIVAGVQTSNSSMTAG